MVHDGVCFVSTPIYCLFFSVMAFQLKVIQFDSTRNKMVCSSMDSIMDPGDGIHTEVLPGVQDGYSLAFSDFLSSDIPCYPSMQSDLHAGIGANDSEVRTGGCLVLLRIFFYLQAISEVPGNNYCFFLEYHIHVYDFPFFQGIAVMDDPIYGSLSDIGKLTIFFCSLKIYYV